MRTLVSISILCCCVANGWAIDPKLTEQVERLAKSIPNVNAKASAHHWTVQHNSPLSEFTVLATKHAENDWWELTKHQSPKVRALAILAIRWNANPKSIERMLPLMDDKAKTFHYLDYPQAAGVAPTPVPQTVSDFANAFVNSYMESAGYNWGIPTTTTPGFAEYWSARKDRTTCYSWLKVDLQLAEESYNASISADKPPEQRRAPYNDIRREIEGLPFPDRQWTLLGLSAPYASGHSQYHAELLATHAERIESAKTLGSARLFALLANQIQSTDPDIRRPKTDRSNQSFPAEKLQFWILQYAGEIFQAADIPQVLKLTNATRRVEGLIAAAQIAPDQAATYLNAAIKYESQQDRSTERTARIYAAMWKLLGPKSKDTVLDWFFENADGKTRLDPIIDLMATPQGRELLIAAWKDSRCETVAWNPIRNLLEASRTPGKPRIVDYDEQRIARPAFGGIAYGKGSSREYVRDAVAMQKYVADWRVRVLASLNNANE